jgi:hypothetical protein
VCGRPYSADDVTEEVELGRERKRWLEGTPLPADLEMPPIYGGLPIPPPDVHKPGLENRGVRVDGRSTTVLYLSKSKEEMAAEDDEQDEEEEVEEREEEVVEEKEEELRVEPPVVRMQASENDTGAWDEDGVLKRAKMAHDFEAGLGAARGVAPLGDISMAGAGAGAGAGAVAPGGGESAPTTSSTLTCVAPS